MASYTDANTHFYILKLSESFFALKTLSNLHEVTAKFFDSAWAANSVMCTRRDLTICWKAKAPQMGPFTLPASLGAACTMTPFSRMNSIFVGAKNNYSK